MCPPDRATEIRDAPAGYDRTVLRRQPDVRWTDARGPHTATLSGRTVLGSAAHVDLVIADPAVSRIHAELDPREDGVQIRDLGSRNGTFVQGVRVQLASVPEGGRVRVGSVDLTIAYNPAPVAVDVWPDGVFGPLVGGSVVMREMFARLARYAVTDSTVLLLGETGTGKELAARAIHEASPRREQPFVVVDCGAMAENLLEAELFGHARGAFTGAADARAGAIESAEGGTVYLDEIGELPLSMQPKLLRVLESREVRRVGETRYRPVDVRFVSATHRDLRKLVNVRAFREDLYFRLAVLPVTMPPLRDRLDDVPRLAAHFLPRGASPLPPEVLRELAARAWLGNVRELRNFVERAVAVGPREALALEPGDTAASALSPGLFELPFKSARDQLVSQLEREYLRAMLARHGRNISVIAQAAGLNRTYLHEIIKRLGV